MSELKITFKLDARDLGHLKHVMRQASALANETDPEKIVDSALSMIQHARNAKPPAYVLERIGTLEDIASMVLDRDWRLPDSTAKRVCHALAYFANPHDLIPDHVPVFGFLDDALMIEIVAREFRHELEGYYAFRSYRQGQRKRLKSPDQKSLLHMRLEAKRRQIRARIQDRRARDAARNARSKRAFKLW